MVEVKAHQFTYDDMLTAMAMAEEIAAPSMTDAPWTTYRERWGIYALRETVITVLARPCHDAWERAVERYEDAAAAHYDQAPKDPGDFAWDFVPFWLRTCVDWSKDEPRVRGSAHHGS